jgi:hypothetical protein
MKINSKYFIGITGLVGVVLFLITSNIQFKAESTSENKTHDFSLFKRLFNNLGYSIQTYNDSDLPPVDSLLVYFDYTDSDILFLERAKSWVKDGGTLFLAGVHSRLDPITKQRIVEGKVTDVTIRDTYYEGASFPVFEPTKYINNQSMIEKILYTDSKTLMYRQNLGKGYIYVMFDTSFLLNRNLQNDDVAVFWNNVLKNYYNSRIHLVYNRFLYRTYDPLFILIFKTPLTLITLQLFLLLILFFLSHSIRYGKAKNFLLFERRTLMHHLQAVANFYQKSNALKQLLIINTEYFIYKIKSALNLKSTVKTEEVISKTGQLLDKSEEDISKYFYIDNTITYQKLVQTVKGQNQILQNLK